MKGKLNVVELTQKYVLRRQKFCDESHIAKKSGGTKSYRRFSDVSTLLGGSLGRIYKFYKSHTADDPQEAIDKSAIIVAWATNVAIVTAQVRSQMFPLIVG
jgi:hypothetical protein